MAIAVALSLVGIAGAAQAQVIGFMEITAGNNQSGIVGSPLAQPFEVRVTNTDGETPVRGATITWDVLEGRGALSEGSLPGGDASTTVTDRNGVSRIRFTPSSVGLARVRARCRGEFIVGDCGTVQFTASISVRKLTLAIVSGDGQTGILGVPLSPLAVRATSDGNSAVEGASVTWTFARGNGQFSPSSTTTTAGSGQAQVTPTVGSPAAGSSQVLISARASIAVPSGEFSATIESNTVTFTATITPLTIAIVSGDAQAGVVGVALNPFVVKVSNSEAIAGASVAWSFVQGTGTLAPASSTTTASNGQTQTTATVTSAAGTNRIAVTAQASFSSGGRTVFSNKVTFTATVAPLTLAIVSGDGQAGPLNAPLSPFVVRLSDGAGIQGASVTWTFTQGSGTLSPPSPTAIGPDGQSQTTLTPTAGGSNNQVVVTARASLAINEQTVQSNTVTFTVTTRPAALTLAIVSGNAQSGLPGIALPVPFVVRLTSSGDALPGASVNWAFAQGSGTLSPPSPTTTGTNGESQTVFTPTVPGPNGQILVTAVASLVTAGQTLQSNAVTFAVTVTPLTLTIVSGNEQTGALGAPLPIPLGVRVSNGDGVSGASVVWTFTQGTGTLSPASPTTSGANGISQTVLTPTSAGAGGVVVVTAIASLPGGGQTVQSNTVTFTIRLPVTPVTISVVSGNNQTGVINAALPKPVVVRVTGLPASTPVTVTWSFTQGSGSFSPNPSPIIEGQSQTTVTLGPTGGPIRVQAAVTPPGGGVVAAVVDIAVNDVTPVAVAGLKDIAILGNLAITTMSVQTTNIGLRLASLRQGAAGFSTSGLSLNVKGESVPLGAITNLIPSLGGGGASADVARPFGGGLGVFLNGQGSFGDQDTTSRETGFDFHTAGLTLGSDYRFTKNLVLGAAFGYLHTKADLDSGAGDVKTDGYSVSAYGSYFLADKVYIDGIFTYGWNKYHLDRNIDFADAHATANASPDGTQYAFSTAAAYDLSFGSLSVGPTGRINYIHVHIDSFRETGADLFNLSVGDQTVESLTTDLGAQLTYAISMPWGVLSPTLRAEWEHEFKGGARLISGSLVADPLRTPFAVATNDPDRDYFNLGAGVTATFKRGLSGFFYYETVLGREHVTNHSFTAGLRYQFE